MGKTDQDTHMHMAEDVSPAIAARARAVTEAHPLGVQALAHMYCESSVFLTVKQFVQRIGREESPHVAWFYLSHANAFYVKKGHDLGSLVADAEKLRTEWATNRMITSTSAQQADRTQSNLNAAQEAISMLQAEGVV